MKQIQVVQVGLGLIGGTVIEQIAEHRASWRGDGIDVAIAALLTTTGVLTARGTGFTDEQLRRVIAGRRTHTELSRLAQNLGIDYSDGAGFDIRTLGLDRPIVLDAAAGSETTPFARQALDAGGGVVYSNKAPLSRDRTDPDAVVLWRAAQAGRVRYETTCGAGLPVISTLRSLQGTGDRVTAIVGCLSGTLGAIFSDIAAGKPFSAAIRAAKQAGYTEPDPRDDLSGLDVARKALILARTIGRELDLSDIAVESLVPQQLADCSVGTFLERIADYDAAMAERQQRAATAGGTLKYIASVPAEGPITVGIQVAATTTVLGAIQGPENIISIRTERYDRYPLTISGPGAGAAVTAAGMIADMLEFARAG